MWASLIVIISVVLQMYFGVTFDFLFWPTVIFAVVVVTSSDKPEYSLLGVGLVFVLVGKFFSFLSNYEE